MKNNYAKALKAVLIYEGGKIDHPKDPGGRTNEGVTQRVYNSFRAKEKLPLKDVFEMSASERDKIYKRGYWDLVLGDRLPIGLDFVVFDGAVNSGVSRSIMWLQRALGAHYSGKIDGSIGTVTLTAVENHGDIPELIQAICALRLRFVSQLKTFKTFGKGWTRRINSVRQQGLAMAEGADHTTMEIALDEGAATGAKANVEDAKPLPRLAIADLSAGGGTAGTGLLQGIGTQLDGARENLAGFTNIDFVQKLIFWLTLASLLIGAAGFLAGLWVRRRRAEQMDALDMVLTKNEGIGL